MNIHSLVRCLADETRLTVVQELATEEELCVSDLVDRTGKEQTNVSHHLAELRTCGLVEGRQEGRFVNYRLAHPRLGNVVADLEALAEHIACTEPEVCLTQGCC